MPSSPGKLHKIAPKSPTAAVDAVSSVSSLSSESNANCYHRRRHHDLGFGSGQDDSLPKPPLPKEDLKTRRSRSHKTTNKNNRITKNKSSKTYPLQTPSPKKKTRSKTKMSSTDSVSSTEPPSPTNTEETEKAASDVDDATPTKDVEKGTTSKPKKVAAAAASSNNGNGRKGIFKYLEWILLAIVILAILVIAFVLATPAIQQAVAEARHARNPTMAPSVSIAPSSIPSDMPSMIPSDFPSTMPSSIPSDLPSQTPSQAPSSLPSQHPSSAPSTTPTASPTKFEVDPHPIPNNAPRGYFNYDRNSDYGPHRWSRVDTSRHPLREFRPDGWGPFRGLFPEDITDNQCGGPERRQSPKDMSPTIVCDAHHEIRTWCGDYKLTDGKFDVQILPHKLSLVMNRRPCSDVESTACQQNEPPIADYPRYSSFQTSFSDLITYDVKIPSEHTIKGKQYDAEIQMLHIHPGDARISSIGIVIEATPNGHNSDFQAVLNQFQIHYDKHENSCRRRERNLRWWNDTDKFVDGHDDDSSPFVRQMNVGGFDPYSDKLFPTMFFYRYDGSITEPPCKDLTWWVLTEPMKISVQQLDQAKNLLFTHVDEDSCKPTSVHNRDQSVARPIFPLGDDREIQDCSAGSFRSDVDKGRLPGRRCRAN